MHDYFIYIFIYIKFFTSILTFIERNVTVFYPKIFFENLRTFRAKHVDNICCLYELYYHFFYLFFLTHWFLSCVKICSNHKNNIDIPNSEFLSRDKPLMFLDICDDYFLDLSFFFLVTDNRNFMIFNVCYCHFTSTTCLRAQWLRVIEKIH